METVLDAIRRNIMRWTITKTDLTVSAQIGDTSITVDSTRRFRKGDQFLIYNDAVDGEDMENLLYVKEIVGRHTIHIGDAEGNTKALKWAWPLSRGAHIAKTQDNLLVKAVILGDPDIITNLPAITVSASNKSSEWYAMRSTKEKYNLEIGIYVSGSTQEEGDRFLLRLAKQIDYGLKQNLYPLLNDFETTTITANIVAGDMFVKIADTTKIKAGYQIYIEDGYNIQVVGVHSICDSSTIQLAQQAEYNFDKDETTVIRPNRLPFNSWPTDINFTKIKKGTLLKAAIISYFVEELEDQQNASFGDTQLT